jgi:alginate O-acetyltransferase complex protein AlgJ
LRGDLRPEADGPTETLPAWVVTPPAGATTAPDSPVLVIGDSHCLVFHIGEDLHGTGAGLPDHLAAALAAPVDVVAVRGADACSPLLNIARRARKDPAWLAGKRVVVWTFAARAFTEAANGWSMIPLSKR